jgi:hypothetical protein
MSSFFLDVHDKIAVLDFITGQLPYLPDVERKKDDARLRTVEGGKEHPTVEEMADWARTVGKKSWPARQALAAYLKTQSGCDEEWKKVLANLSAGTAHLLERFRHGTKSESIDIVLAHEESSSAFRELERLEIEHVRREIHAAIWKGAKKKLAMHLKEADGALTSIQQRIEILRELAADTPRFQDELLGKIRRWEDDLYFEGKVLDVKELDAEIAYYREEKELPAEG